MTLIYVFPGQGSQAVGMGENLFDRYKEFTETADSILGYSIKELCVRDSQDQLKLTQYTQPALYVVNALSYFRALDEDGRMPDHVAGHSLGEYDALFAAGVFDFATGLRLVKKRGELMAKARDGAMAAVIGISSEQIDDILRSQSIPDVWVANYNSPMQTVISGTVEGIKQCESVFTKAGAAFIPLNVSGAFHSALMRDAQQEFSEFAETFQFRKPVIPVISNLRAAPYASEPDVIRDTLVKQIANPVRWNETVQFLLTKEDPQFVEIGPGQTLTNLIEKIKRAFAALA